MLHWSDRHTKTYEGKHNTMVPLRSEGLALRKAEVGHGSHLKESHAQ